MTTTHVNFYPNDHISAVVDPSSIRWKEVGQVLGGDPACFLKATIQIGITPFHLEAIEVRTVDGRQEGVNEHAEEILAKVYLLACADRPLDTIFIGDGVRKYVVYATPYCP
jgi:hypothetical protein